MQDDNLLVERIQKGEKELFSVLYEKYCHKILYFLFYKCNDMSKAEDLAADTFMKAFDAIGSFRPQRENGFSSWLYTIATNIFLDSVKKKKEASFDEMVEFIPDDAAGNMTDKIQVGQQAEEILTYLDTLGPDKKELFVMRIWQDMSWEEIEAVTKKSSAALRKEYSRLVQKLIEKFGYMAVLSLLYGGRWIK